MGTSSAASGSPCGPSGPTASGVAPSRPIASGIGRSCLMAFGIGSVFLMLAACGAPKGTPTAGAPAQRTAPTAATGQPVPAAATVAGAARASAGTTVEVRMPEAEPGLYRCELDRKVTVRRIAPDRRSLVLNWQGQDHPMQAVAARTGALRYESPQHGLTWLVIDGKSMLLDSKRGRQLANECKL